MTSKETLPPPPADQFTAGQVLAEILTLREKISSSPVGITWLAEENGKLVTLFFPAPILCADPHTVEELRSQVAQNRKLVHPGVVRTYDFIEEEGWIAISTDSVEGVTLAARLAAQGKHYFEVSEIQSWISGICQTLDDAHRVNLLHRDLSPQNILIPNSGGILLANFGTSRIMLDAISRLGGPKIDEHLAYMSPQQLDGEFPARWDDIYALGILIYELLTGKPPFHSGELVPQIRKNRPPSIADRRAELGIKGEPIPPQWEKVVASCLEKHTPERPKSAREVGIKLGGEAAVESSASDAPSATAPKAAIAKEPAPRREPAAAVEDIVWNKRPRPAEAPPNLAHLLQTVPDTETGQAKKKSPNMVVVFIIALVVTILVLSHFAKHHPAQPTPAPIAPIFTPVPVTQPQASPTAVAAASPTAKPAPSAKALPSVAAVASVSPSVAPVPVVSLANITDETARKAIEAAQKDIQDKTKAQQEAAADVQLAQKSLSDKIASIELMKKAVADADNISKQRQDAEAKAIADAEAAKRTAEQKAAAIPDATKAKEQSLAQLKDQQDALLKSQNEIQSLQQTIASKQQVADDAAKAVTTAGADLQKQQAAALAAQSKPAQPQPSVSPAVSPSPAAVTSTGSSAFQDIDTQPLAMTGSSRNPLEIEHAERVVVNEIKEKDTSAATPAPQPTVPITYVANPRSQIDKTMVNSIGMKFAPVDNQLFCIWLTRVQDFQTFAAATEFKPVTWRQPGFKQGPDHPVVDITWNDAIAFCKWLTEKEQKEGLLAPNQSYRLPTDLEWSKAVGLPPESGRTPEARDMDVPGVYPWGKEWPPPAGAGNYTGEETGSDVAIKGYDDGYSWTSPVGVFSPNKYGLYDMGGNAWEWCMDWSNDQHSKKVLRGASWYNGGLQLSLLSSCREYAAADISTDNYGFRVVIVTESKSKR